MKPINSDVSDRTKTKQRSVWKVTTIRPESLPGALLRLPLKLIPPNLTMRILSGPLKGFRWISGASNATCWMGLYEYDKQSIFQKLVKPGHVVFDLGANVGFYSLLASRLVGDNGRVIAFEPGKRNIALLRRHLTMNGICNCQVMEAAVCSQEGSSFFEPSPMPVSSHIVATQSASTYEVKTVVLDMLVRRALIPKPQLIKCDIEGAEYEALMGAREILKNCRPVVVLATHGSEVHERCCDLLTALHYSVQAIEPGASVTQTDEVLACPMAATVS